MSFRITAIAFAALVIFGGAVWFSEFRDKGAEATAPDKQKLEVFKFDDKDSTQIEVARVDQKVMAQKDDQGNWTLQPSGLPGDRVRISSVVSRMGSLQATK